MIVSVELHALADLRAHAAAEHPAEACGLLFGTPTALTRYVPMENVAENPASGFAMDPIAVARAEHAGRRDGLRLCAAFHSHPEATAALMLGFLEAGRVPSFAPRRARVPAALVEGT